MLIRFQGDSFKLIFQIRNAILLNQVPSAEVPEIGTKHITSVSAEVICFKTHSNLQPYSTINRTLFAYVLRFSEQIIHLSLIQLHELLLYLIKLVEMDFFHNSFKN